MLFCDWPRVYVVGSPFSKVLIFPEIWLPAQPCQYLHSLTTLVVSAIPVLFNGVLSNLFRFLVYLFILMSHPYLSFIIHPSSFLLDPFKDLLHYNLFTTSIKYHLPSTLFHDLFIARKAITGYLPYLVV